jgi:4'-phosphopantetheinyl transferase
VIAVADRTRVGIDIEFVRPIQDIEGMRRLVFTKEEQKFVLAQPLATQQRIFYRLWTRKEAVLKALGLGIDTSIDKFSVFSSTPEICLSLSKDLAGDLPTRWYVTDISGFPDQYACALCKEAGERNKQPGTTIETDVVFRN